MTTVMASEEPLNLQHMQVVEERGGAAYEARARTLALWEPLGTTVAHRRWEGHGQEGHTPDKSREGRRGRMRKGVTTAFKPLLESWAALVVLLPRRHKRGPKLSGQPPKRPCWVPSPCSHLNTPACTAMTSPTAPMTSACRPPTEGRGSKSATSSVAAPAPPGASGSSAEAEAAACGWLSSPWSEPCPSDVPAPNQESALAPPSTATSG